TRDGDVPLSVSQRAGFPSARDGQKPARSEFLSHPDRVAYRLGDGALRRARRTRRRGANLGHQPSPGWGFEAIAVALVARLNPLAIVVTAIFFGALDNGSQAMQRAEGVSPVLVQVIQAMVILILLAFDTSCNLR